ncbi:tol-pal system YbgF family protein [Kribbella sp. NPDC058245]|uniref:tetratricopeptide repeat protein n=1 Tax=Kribbella sp. NPDC058245 TaxID=3346399 RepID=UPI0036EB7CE9
MKDDRLAAAVGNASLLGIGYVLLRRWRLAIAAPLISIALVLLVVAQKALWCEIVLLVWWVAVVVHGWLLGGKPGTRSATEQRLIALCVTVPVLLAGVFFRVEAVGIQNDVADARAAGDCAGVTAAQQKARYGDRVADAPGIERLGVDVEACQQLQEIALRLEGTWSGDVDLLGEQFAKLGEVLAKPGQEKTVEKVLDQYLGTVTKGGPCPTVELATWLRGRHQTQNVLDKANSVGDGLVPEAQFECAQSEAKAAKWRAALGRYQELIGQYPHAAITPKARAAMALVAVKVELLDVRGLVTSGEYCDKPAKYSGAPLYRRGVNRALFLGETNEYLDQLPRQWKTDVPTNASVVICTEAVEDGPAIRTCPYTRETDPNLHFNRTFRKVVVPVRIYALRTGKLVRTGKVTITGEACPLVYTDDSGLTPVYGSTISTPVDPSDANVRAAFQPLLVRR